jgi:hypothetical protein
MGPRNARFSGIPRSFDACIYAVELTNGLVKVGFSRNPRTRMTSLRAQVARVFGADIARFHIGVDLPLRAAVRAEGAALIRIGRIGTVVCGHKEFFTGVCFGAAVTLVSQVSRRAAALSLE